MTHKLFFNYVLTFCEILVAKVLIALVLLIGYKGHLTSEHFETVSLRIKVGKQSTDGDCAAAVAGHYVKQ